MIMEVGDVFSTDGSQQLMLPSLPPREKEDFKAGLWQLHEQTARLPPLTDRALSPSTCHVTFINHKQ